MADEDLVTEQVFNDLLHFNYRRRAARREKDRERLARIGPAPAQTEARNECRDVVGPDEVPERVHGSKNRGDLAADPVEKKRRNEAGALPGPHAPVDRREANDDRGDPGREKQTFFRLLQLSIRPSGSWNGARIHLALPFEQPSGGAEMDDTSLRIPEFVGASSAEREDRPEIGQFRSGLVAAGCESGAPGAPHERQPPSRRRAAGRYDLSFDPSELSVSLVRIGPV